MNQEAIAQIYNRFELRRRQDGTIIYILPDDQLCTIAKEVMQSALVGQYTTLLNLDLQYEIARDTISSLADGIEPDDIWDQCSVYTSVCIGYLGDCEFLGSVENHIRECGLSEELGIAGSVMYVYDQACQSYAYALIEAIEEYIEDNGEEE